MSREQEAIVVRGICAVIQAMAYPSLESLEAQLKLGYELKKLK